MSLLILRLLGSVSNEPGVARGQRAAGFGLLLVQSLLLGLGLITGFGQAATAWAQQPVQVYLLVGQSNMQGHAQVRTLEHLKLVPDGAALRSTLLTPAGQPRVAERVWISYLSTDGVKQGRLTTGFGASDDKLGPELMFGLSLEQTGERPILLIKTAWGGKSLNTDFRPPSAGPYPFSEEQLEQFRQQGKDVEAMVAEKQQATGHYYRLMLEHVRNVLADPGQVIPDYDPDQGYELAGLVWFQGWNDMVDRGTYPDRDQPNGYGAYSEVMAHFIRDVRRDLQAPQLPVVIGVLGVGGPVELYREDQQRYRGIHQNFRDAMAAPAGLPEFKGNVVAVKTETCWDQELTDLRYRENQLRQQVRQRIADGALAKNQEREELERLKRETWTPREVQVLETGISNAEFHYLGSAAILSRIGQAFAAALNDLD